MNGSTVPTVEKSSRSRNGGPIGALDAVHRAMEQLAAFTGRPVESVSAYEQRDQGWRLEVEVVELERVPSSTSVLATYEVELDGAGELQRYQRIRRYNRNAADDS